MPNINLSSTHSMTVALKSISENKKGLTKRRLQMLNRTPKSGDWANFAKEYVTINDLAYLSAYTNHEYALLRGKNNDILFHGTHYKCNFDEELCSLLISSKLILIAHSHPDEDEIVPSSDDREFLKAINQEKSIIISWKTGRTASFTSNVFDI